MQRPFRKSWVVMGAALAAAVLIIGLLPLLLMTLPNPTPVKIPSLEGERVGAYMELEDGFYKLYPFSAPPQDFPQEAISLSAQPRLVVKYRQLDALSAYELWTWPDNQQVPASKDTSVENSLEMEPESPLAPGEYYATAARDGIYGGRDYFYFRIDPNDLMP